MGMVMEKKRIRIIFNDGVNVKRKDGDLLELTTSYVKIIDNKDNIVQIIPLHQIYRLLFLDREGKDENKSF